MGNPLANFFGPFFAQFPKTPIDPKTPPKRGKRVGGVAAAASTADLLAWMMKLDEHITVNYDGTIWCTFLVEAKNDLSWAPRDARNVVAEKLNTAIRELPDGWMTQAWRMRKPITRYTPGVFTDRASWLVDEERRLTYESGRHYGTTLYYTFSYLPPPDARTKTDRLIYVYDRKIKTQGEELHEAISTYRTGIRNVMELMREHLVFTPLGLRRTDMNGESVVVDDQLSHAYRVFTGIDQPVRALPPGYVVNEYLATSIRRFAEGVLRVGDAFVRPITVLDFPAKSEPALLDALEAIPGTFAIVNRFIARDRERAEAEIRSLRGRAMQKRTSLKDSATGNPEAMVDAAAVRTANDAEDAFAESRAGDVAFGFFSFTVLVYDTNVKGDTHEAWTRVTKLSDEIIGTLRGLGFIVDVEDDNELEALLGSLPAHGYANLVRGMLSSRNLANFLPTTTIWTGDWAAVDKENYGVAGPLAIFTGSGTTPFALNLHSGNRGGHTLIVGDTGAGKTSAVGFLINRHRQYPGSQQIVIDNQYQHEAQMRAVGGRHIVLSPDGEEGLSPLAGSDLEGIPNREHLIAMMLRAQGIDPRPHAEAILHGLHYLAYGDPANQRISGLMSAPSITSEVRDALRHYSERGSLGRLFDNARAQRAFNRMTVFETVDLPKDPATKTIALTALEIEIDALVEARRPTLIASEEVWELLRDPIGAEMFLKGLKKKRRKGAAYILITQGLDDIDSSEIAKAIIGACVTKLILPDENAVGDNAERLARLGLNAWERQGLKNHVGRHAMYVIKPEGRRMIDITLGPVALATVAQTSSKALESVRHFYDTWGADAYPELVFNAFAPGDSERHLEIAESWRRHAYFYEHKDDGVPLGVAAPQHVFAHVDDPHRTAPALSRDDLLVAAS
jgi:type IV secretion system protein VirB4